MGEGESVSQSTAEIKIYKLNYFTSLLIGTRIEMSLYKYDRLSIDTKEWFITQTPDRTNGLTKKNPIRANVTNNQINRFFNLNRKYPGTVRDEKTGKK